MPAALDPTPARRPQRRTLEGRYVTLVPLDRSAHADALWEAIRAPEHDPLWRYLFDGPFRDRSAFDAAIEHKASTDDPLFFGIVDGATGCAAGYASYMRIEPAH